jgi:hypothetical protein
MDSDSVWFPVPDKNAANRGDLVVKNKIPVGMFQRKRMIPSPVWPIGRECIALLRIGSRQVQSRNSGHELRRSHKQAAAIAGGHKKAGPECRAGFFVTKAAAAHETGSANLRRSSGKPECALSALTRHVAGLELACAGNSWHAPEIIVLQKQIDQPLRPASDHAAMINFHGYTPRWRASRCGLGPATSLGLAPGSSPGATKSGHELAEMLRRN